MICPPGTSTCKVTKRNDPNDFQTIIRHRRCLDRYGDILIDEKVNEPNTLNSVVNMVVSSGGGNSIISGGDVREMTPEERQQLEETLRRTQQQIQSSISNTMTQLQTQLGPLMDGSFATKLNNQIRSSIRNSFI